MNRKLLVTLLHKNIEELNVITEGFMEMNDFPAAILHLARRKTEDIQTIIDQLASIQNSVTDEKKAGVTEINHTVTKPRNFEVNFIHPSQIQQTAELIKDDLAGMNAEELDFPVEPVNSEVIAEETVIEETEEVIEMTSEETEEVVSLPGSEEIVVESTEKTELTEEFNQITIKITTEESKKTTIADKIISPTVSRNEILAKTDKSLSASIAHKKIDDIKQAISIGDRFRFQRELFRGNGEDMNKTLNYINQLATLNEAVTFLQSKYGWDTGNETTEDFYQILKRKFL